MEAANRFFLIRIAELDVGIWHRYDYVYDICQQYRVTDCEPDFTVVADEAEIAGQLAEYAEDKITPFVCEAVCIYRKICHRLPEFGAFMMHSVALAMDGKAYLFLARSGVGKTTHALQWWRAFRDRVSVINGDKPVLRKIEGRWCACGTPWSGKERLNQNQIVPIEALCLLARGEENQIQQVAPETVLNRIFCQILLPQGEAETAWLFDLIEDLLDSVRCYSLSCTISVEAAKIAYAAMNGIEGVS